MPSINSEHQDRIADLIEELVDKLDEHISVPPEPPVVNVEAAKVTVPAPIVNVAAPARGAWLFTVSRGNDGLIHTITVTPKD